MPGRESRNLSHVFSCISVHVCLEVARNFSFPVNISSCGLDRRIATCVVVSHRSRMLCYVVDCRRMTRERTRILISSASSWSELPRRGRWRSGSRPIGTTSRGEPLVWTPTSRDGSAVVQCRDSIGIGLQPAQLSDQLFETLSPLVQRLIETNYATNSIRNEDM